MRGCKNGRIGDSVSRVLLTLLLKATCDCHCLQEMTKNKEYPFWKVTHVYILDSVHLNNVLNMNNCSRKSVITADLLMAI